MFLLLMVQSCLYSTWGSSHIHIKKKNPIFTQCFGTPPLSRTVSASIGVSSGRPGLVHQLSVPGPHSLNYGSSVCFNVRRASLLFFSLNVFLVVPACCFSLCTSHLTSVHAGLSLEWGHLPWTECGEVGDGGCAEPTLGFPKLQDSAIGKGRGGSGSLF